MSKKIDNDVLHTESVMSSLESTVDHVTTDSKKRVRPERKLDPKAGPLSFPLIPGMRYYVADYDPGEYSYDYEKLIDKGYEPVLRKQIDPSIEKTDPALANKQVIFSTGKGTRGILLMIPQEWWDEDYEREVKENASKVTNKQGDSEANEILAEAGGALKPTNGALRIDTRYGKL